MIKSLTFMVMEINCAAIFQISPNLMSPLWFKVSLLIGFVSKYSQIFRLVNQQVNQNILLLLQHPCSKTHNCT